MDALIKNKTGFKKTKIGLIPDDWNYTTFDDITNITRLAGYEYSEYWKESDNGKIIGLRGYNIGKGKLDLKDISFISDELSKQLIRSRLFKGDIAYPCVGSIGNAVVIDEDDKYHIQQNIAKITCSKKSNPHFICQFLLSPKALKEVYRFNATSSQPNVLVGSLRQFRIGLPPLPEQKKIAEILSTWDKAIEHTSNLIEQLKKRKKGLMQKLLTGKTRLAGFSGEWKEVKLGNYLIKHNEVTTESKQYPVLTSSRRGIFFQSDYYTRDVASDDSTGYNVVPRGYFTYRHMSDDLVFKFNINTICDKGIVSTLYPVFTVKDGLNKTYLLHLLNEGNEFKRYALQQKQGGSRTYMYFGKLQNLRVPLPSIEEQNEIVKCIETYEKELNSYENLLSEYESQKKGLMQQLLTGQKRVSVN